MCAFWKNKKIDKLRQGISIPGVTLTYLFTTLESGISLFDEKNKDLHQYHEAGKTKIREKGPSCKTCPPDRLQDAERKLASREEVLPGWQPSG